MNHFWKLWVRMPALALTAAGSGSARREHWIGLPRSRWLPLPPWWQGWPARSRPGMKPTTPIISGGMKASLRAAYATSLEEMDSTLAPYGVDVFVTGPQVWAQTSYVAPFEGLASELIGRGGTLGFVLQSPPPDRVLFKSGEYYVVRVERSADVRSAQ